MSRKSDRAAAQQPHYQAVPTAPEGYTMVPVAPPVKRGLRKLSWFILLVNVLFLVWIIVGASSSKATNCGTLSAADCTTATQIGTGIGAVLIVVLWAVVDVILLVIWMITRPRQR